MENVNQITEGIWQTSKVEQLFDAIQKAQFELKNIVKESKADIGSFSYKYAELADVIDHIKEVFKKYNLSFVQHVHGNNQNEYKIYTQIQHKDGQFMASSMPVVYSNGLNHGKMNPIQALGSAITYSRRYSLMSLVGIAGEDDDGRSVGEKLDPNKVENFLKEFPQELKDIVKNIKMSRKTLVELCIQRQWQIENISKDLKTLFEEVKHEMNQRVSPKQKKIIENKINEAKAKK